MLSERMMVLSGEYLHLHFTGWGVTKNGEAGISSDRAGREVEHSSAHGDTLLVLSRSYAYVSLPPYQNFQRIELPMPKEYDGKVASLSYDMAALRSGELFGSIGKLIVDGIAIILVMLVHLSRLIFWLKPKQKRLLRFSLQWHDKIGGYTVEMLTFV